MGLTDTEEVKKVADYFNKIEKAIANSKICSKIAIHYSSQAQNCFSSAPLIKGFDYRQTLIEKYYSALKHYNVDVIDDSHSLEGYEAIISPFLACVDDAFRKRITEYVENGGVWIAGPMTDIMNSDVSCFTHSPYGFLEEFAGVYTKYRKPVGNGVFRAVWADGTQCSVSTCYDAYECKDGTESLAEYDGDEFGGLSVITSRKVGKGKVVLVGSVISHGDMLRLMRQKPVAEASGNIILTECDNGVIFAVETQNT